MATHGSESGVPGERVTEHYVAIAKNPLVGLVITEHAYVDVQGKADPRQVSFASDSVVASQKAMTDAIRRANPDVRIFAQINHAGANTKRETTGEELVSASAIRMDGETARALTVDEIKALEKKFAAAALRVKRAGYDGVEIHCAHGYLLNQFYSPLVNSRTDEYGAQNVENRLRFLLETVAETRRAVGDEFPIAARLGGCDYTPGGSTIQDAVEAAALLERSGVDLIDLSGGLCGYVRRDNRAPGWFADMSGAVKEKTTVPVLVTGGVTRPEQAEALMMMGKADLVGVGRALYRDPNWGF